MEHHRRGAGHVLHRRLSLVGRQADLLPPHPVDYDPGGRRRPDVQPDRPDLRHLHRRAERVRSLDGRQRGRRQHDRLVLRQGTSFGNATWITYSQTAAANGNGSTSWNTTGVAPGTYYIGGYLWSGGKPTYSHLTQSITIKAAAAPTFTLTGPTSGTLHRRPDGHDPLDGRQRRRRQHDLPLLRHGTPFTATRPGSPSARPPPTATAPTPGTPPAWRRARTTSAAISSRTARRPTPTSPSRSRWPRS